MPAARPSRTLLRADALGWVLVHGDDFRGRYDLDIGFADQLWLADQDDRNALINGKFGSGDNVARSVIAAHGVDGNGQHRVVTRRR